MKVLAMRKNIISPILVLFFLMQMMFSAGLVQAKLRNLKAGDKMPTFTLAKLAGGEFSYPSASGKVLLVGFVSARQKQSEHACIDMQKVVSQFDSKQVEAVAITTKADNKEYFQSLQKEEKLTFAILLDSKYHLWGQLGVIATPTIIIVDKDGVISWIKAGNGYDFASTLRAHLAETLGLGGEELSADTSPVVKTLTPGSVTSRMKRHLKMAKKLAAKNLLEPAIAELRKAQELTPDSAEIKIELSQLLCLQQKSAEALELIAKLKTDRKSEQAKVKMLSGWAHRQLGDLAQAEKLLKESLKLNPKSARALFELGKIYQVRNDHEKAMQAYNQSLSVVFKEPTSGSISH